jgi:alpha-D-xyloside xylohydrolase
MAGDVTHNNFTMMRALVMDFPNDAEAVSQKYQFMFGKAFMICPVIEPGIATQTNYLPRDSKWIDFWTGESFDGGLSVERNVPLSEMPIYVRAGSIVTMGPFLQYANEKLPDPLEIRIYPGADGTYSLYEDEGENYNYENGKFTTIAFTWDNNSKVLSIGKRTGEFDGMMEKRTFNIIIVQPNQGVGISEPAEYTRTVDYKGDEIFVNF